MREKTMRIDNIKLGLLKIAGYCVFLIQSVPVWTGLMTLPFAVHLVMILTNIQVNLPILLSEFFSPFLIPEKTFIIIGLIFIIYSVINLQISKRKGLVTSGPYRLVRHPQYIGMITTTLGFTSWSIWWLKNTFGIGFLNPLQTIGLWFIELLAYILLANMEEYYLIKKFGESFVNYKNQVPFFIPFLNTKKKSYEIIISIIIPTITLFGLIWIN
jgi:protein-S-isoprenylcysteine O-methyltransferase Ste14